MKENLSNFTDVFGEDEIINDSQESQPISLPSSAETRPKNSWNNVPNKRIRPAKGTGQYNEFRSIEEIDSKYRDVFSYPFFNLVQSRVIEDALYSDKSLVVCAPTGSGKTVIFEMAIVQLLMEMEEKQCTEDFKIIYMAPVKALCTERLTEWYSKFNKLGLLCIEVTGDTDVDFSQLQAFKVIITTPEKWDMLTRRWKDHRGLVEMIKLFLIDEVHILNDESRGPVLEAVVSRMKTIQSAAQLAHRIEKLQKQYQANSSEGIPHKDIEAPTIRFVAVSATVSNPEDVAAWLKTDDKPAVYYKFGDECRPVKLKRVVEGYPCPDGTSIFKFDIILNYKLWPIIQKYHDGKPTLIFCNTRKSVLLTAETLSREITITFNPEQKAKLTALASNIKNKKFQALVLAGVGCHHAGMLYEERTYMEYAFRNGDLPILITTTTLAMGVNLPAHLVIIKNTQQYVNGAYQEYSISTVLQMVGRAGRPQFDTEATAVIMTRQKDKARYQALAGGSEPLQSYLHKRLAENLNSEAALGTVCDVAQCVQWLRSTFLYVRAAKDPKRYLGLTSTAPDQLILKKIEELCVRAMNGLASAGLISMDEASCIESTEAGRLMSVFYLDLETMKLIMKIQGNETLERLLWLICDCHELAEMHLRMDERRTLNTLNRNNAAATIRFPMKGKISSRQMKLNCIIQAVLGCLPIPDPSLNQEAMKIMRIADRVCKCLVAYVTRPEPVTLQLQYFSAVLNTIILAKCIAAHLWENSPYVSKQLKGIGPTFSTLLATAGKVNFMLLEESHPRDLERIMNKGPPAGNVLRKQISLLPKYHLEATPIDEKTVSVKLLLLNQAHLSENMDNLTAGASHKCYVIAGDSKNHLLLLTTFIDKDLIRVYDGTITYEITRKHCFEHKITVHCISSCFAGIDAQCEYTFADLIPAGSYNVGVDTSSHFFEGNTKAIHNKQPKEVDTPKNRKRKNNADEITQSKEKKKRDNAFAEKFKLLKESFGRTSTVLKKDLQKTEEITRNVLNDLGYTDQPTKDFISKENNDLNTKPIDDFSVTNVEINFPDNDDDIMDDEKIHSILNEIESEITKVNTESKRHQIDKDPKLFNKTTTFKQNQISRKRVNINNNFKFLDVLDNNTENDEDVPDVVPVRETGFSEAIKFQIDNFMQKSSNAPPTIDLTLSNFIKPPKYAEITRNANEEFNDLVIISPEHNFQDEQTGENINQERYVQTEEPKTCELNKRQSSSIVSNRTEEEYCSENEELPEIHMLGPTNKLVSTNNFEKKVFISLIEDGNIKNVDSRTINNEIAEIQNYQQIDLNVPRLTQNEINDPKYNISYDSTIKKYNGSNVPNRTEAEYCSEDGELPEIHIIGPTNELVSTINSEKEINTNKDGNIKNDDTRTIKNEIAEIQNNQQIDLNVPRFKQNEIDDPHYNISYDAAINEYNGTGEIADPMNDLEIKENNNDDNTNPNNYLQSVIVPSWTKPAFTSLFNQIPMNNPNNLVLLSQRQNKLEFQQINNSVAKVGAHNIKVDNTIESQICSVFNAITLPKQYKEHGSLYTQHNKCNLGDTKNTSTEHENNYSFSAEKVDVHTKYTHDHKIRIIRRLKVDLDVREIVSKCANASDANFSKQVNNINLSNANYLQTKNTNNLFCNSVTTFDQNRIISDELAKNASTVEDNKNNNESIMIEYLKSCTNKFDSTKREMAQMHVEGVQKDIETIALPKDMKADTYSDHKKSIETIKNMQLDYNEKDNSNSQAEPKFEETCKLEDEKQNSDDSANKGNTKLDSNLTSKEKSVENILHKYAQIVRMNKHSDVKNTPNLPPSYTSINIKQAPFKPNRPFRITDIQNLNVSLSSFTDDMKPSPVSGTPAENADSDITNRTQQTYSEHKSVVTNRIQKTPFTLVEEIHPEKSLDHIDLTPCQSPVQLLEQSFEISEDDLKIDQSMFNPKTLLQNMGRDEMDLEIIPPPPEFCNDDISYSPEMDVDDQMKSPDYIEEMNQTLDETHDISVLDDVFPGTSNLTPSKEIETWTLKSDSDFNHGFQYTNPSQSYTVMRRKMFQSYNNRSQNSQDSTSRQGRLSQFKFSSKNKLKL